MCVNVCVVCVEPRKRAVVALELCLPLVEGSDDDLPLLRAGCRSAIRLSLSAGHG